MRILLTIATCIFGVLFILNLHIITVDEQITRSMVINEVAFAEEDNLLETLSSNGIVLPTEQHSVLYDPQLGDIEEVLVEKGDIVYVGAPLIKYKNREVNEKIEWLRQNQNGIQLQLDKLDADIMELQSQLNGLPYEEYEELENNHFNRNLRNLIYQQLNEKNFERRLLETELTALDTKINALGYQENQLLIESKIDGVVTNVNKDSLAAHSELITITSFNSFQVEGTISEYEVTNINEGQKAYITVKALENSTLEGFVEDITMVPIPEVIAIDEETKASFYPFTIAVNDPLETLHHGFHVDIDFVLMEKQDIISIPEQAVVSTEHEDYVFVIKDGIIEKRIISTGILMDGQQEVISGLEAGERIVAHPLHHIETGTRSVSPLQYKELKLIDILEFSRGDILRLVGKGMFSY